jgi:hypothetical protein
MPKLIFGVVLSAAFIVAPVEAEVWHAWCGVANGKSFECAWDTRAQCVANTERLGGGGCIENPKPAPAAARAGDRSPPPQSGLPRNNR